MEENFHLARIARAEKAEDLREDQASTKMRSGSRFAEPENSERDRGKEKTSASSPGPWALPFLYFTDDAALYDDAAPCGIYKGVIQKLAEIGKQDENSIHDRLTVLDVGAGTAPCEKHWRAAGGHVRYLKQDFAQYSVGGRTDGGGTKTNKNSVGVSAAAFSSSIRAKSGYAELDIVSDIVQIPLPDESVDVIVCDQVLEHLPDPVDAIRELARLLKKKSKLHQEGRGGASGGRGTGGVLLISHPYGSYLHNLPYHYNGGFTHSWFEYHLSKSGLFNSGVWWNYRWENMRKPRSTSGKYSCSCNSNS